MGKRILILLCLAFTFLTGCSSNNSEQVFAERLLNHDNDIKTETKKLDTVSKDEQANFKKFDFPAIANNANDIEKIVNNMKNIKAEVENVPAPQAMVVKKETYLNCLDKYISTSSKLGEAFNDISKFTIKGLNNMTDKERHDMLQKMKDTITEYNSALSNLSDIRLELTKIKDSK